MQWKICNIVFSELLDYSWSMISFVLIKIDNTILQIQKHIIVQNYHYIIFISTIFLDSFQYQYEWESTSIDWKCFCAYLLYLPTSVLYKYYLQFATYGIWTINGEVYLKISLAKKENDLNIWTVLSFLYLTKDLY